MKKQKLFGTIIALSTMALASCDITDLIIRPSQWIDDSTPVKSIVNTEGRVTMGRSAKDLYTNSAYLDMDACPSLGAPKLLVIPVWFANSGNFILAENKSTIREDIQKAYFGSKEETGWHSVSSYYEEESGGKLKLQGTVSDWYSADYTSNQLDSSSGEALTKALVREATDWFFTSNPSESRKDYDCDGNGHLDGVILIYGAPDSWNSAGGSGSRTNLWAYCAWLEDNNKSIASPTPDVYFWASYDFMYSPPAGILEDKPKRNAYDATGKSTVGGGDTRFCEIDAHTYIHEFGHMLGLEDYYDYATTNQTYPAACFSMQDNNVGGHDPFSLIELGWTDPYIPMESCTIEIGAFTTNHDVILLTPEWNAAYSPFDEYILIELYSPSGVNKFDHDYRYQKRYPQGASKTGLRVWHVDARLTRCTNKLGTIVWSTDLTTDPNKGNVHIAASNTSKGVPGYESVLGSYGDKYYDYNLLQLIRKGDAKKELADSDLFYSGDTFTMNDFRKQFPNNGKLNSQKELGWEFAVNIEGSGGGAVATINLTKK